MSRLRLVLGAIYRCPMKRLDPRRISSTLRSVGGAHDVPQVERHRDWVRLAESLGLHSVWLPEMHFAEGVCPAPLVGLAELVSLTKRLRLGTTSLLLPLHPPDELASEIAALDRISGGRLLIGLGRGFQKKMLEAFRRPWRRR